MNRDLRYNSGTRLTRTDREKSLDWLEKVLGVEWPVQEYLELKKCSNTSLKILSKSVLNRIQQERQIMTRYNLLRDRLEKVAYQLFYNGQKDQAMELLNRWSKWWNQSK